jgi:hypothetical protein
MPHFMRHLRPSLSKTGRRQDKLIFGQWLSGCQRLFLEVTRAERPAAILLPGVADGAGAHSLRCRLRA